MQLQQRPQKPGVQHFTATLCAKSNQPEIFLRVYTRIPRPLTDVPHGSLAPQEFHMLDSKEGRISELSAVDSLLKDDLRNNSAWNHRWFVVHSSLGPGGTPSDEVCELCR